MPSTTPDLRIETGCGSFPPFDASLRRDGSRAGSLFSAAPALALREAGQTLSNRPPGREGDPDRAIVSADALRPCSAAPLWRNRSKAGAGGHGFSPPKSGALAGAAG